MKNKTVIIKGIGKISAELFAKQEATVVSSNIQKAEGKATATAESIITTGGKASFFKTDVSKPEDMEALVSFRNKNIQ